MNWSEADTRIKVVDKIVFDVLGWDKNLSSYEERAGYGFTDYTLKESNCARLIVEAKKDSISFDLSKRQSAKPYDLKGPAFNSASKDGINQAITYSAFKGAELACVTNGQEWIVFRSNRLGDGKDVLDGKAFIFKSIDDITDNFKIFYDLLSCDSSKKLNFRGLFQSAEGIPVRDLAFFESAQDPDNKKLLDRGEFSADFDAIMSAFFERLKGDQDSEMIQKCFVVSPESDLAEEKLLRIASDISEKIKSLNPKTGEQLISLIEHVKLTSKNRFILLVGNKGAGKSTFIDRFFRFVLPAEHQTYLKLLRIDLSKNTGDKSNIISWLDRQLLEEAEQAVFDETNQQSGWDELVGKIFFSDYQRWSQRTMKGLYEKDKEQFKIQFGQHIEKIRSDQPNEYIKKLINYLTKSNCNLSTGCSQ